MLNLSTSPGTTMHDLRDFAGLGGFTLLMQPAALSSFDICILHSSCARSSMVARGVREIHGGSDLLAFYARISIVLEKQQRGQSRSDRNRGG